MNIRRAEKRDIEKIVALLCQVLEIHAKIRPDIFIPGTTKYTAEELEKMITDDNNPIYVAEDEEGVSGYAFCRVKEPEKSNNAIPFRSLYIDDLCVDASRRGRYIGSQLFGFVKKEAEKLGCYEITLNVWEGNEDAERFYENLGMKTKFRQMELVLKGDETE